MPDPKLRSEASMGPRHFCRGNRFRDSSFDGQVQASMGPRHFCRGNLSIASTAVSLWLLQWGHGISAVEIQRSRWHAEICRCASMGPRHFCRGNRHLVVQKNVVRNRFNGATAFLPWKFSKSIPGTGAVIPLQWGHGISAVEIPRTKGEHDDHNTLQWGHGISAVEIYYW